MATTTFRYTFYPANASPTSDTPVTWLLNGANHNVPNATILQQGQGVVPISTAMDFAVPSSIAIQSAMQVWSNCLDISFSSTIGTKNIAFGGWNPRGTYGSATSFNGIGNFASNYAVLFNKDIKLGVDLSQATIGNWGGWVNMHEFIHIFTGNLDNGSSNDLRQTILYYPTILGVPPNQYIDPSVKIPLTPGMQDIKDLQDGVKNTDGTWKTPPLGPQPHPQW